MKTIQAFGILLAVAASNAGANTVYSYQGGKFDFINPDNANIPGRYTNNMSVAISFELVASLAPNMPATTLNEGDLVSFSFSDGRFVFTSRQTPNDTIGIGVKTDSFGNPNDWFIAGEFLDGLPDVAGTKLNTCSQLLLAQGFSIVRKLGYSLTRLAHYATPPNMQKIVTAAELGQSPCQTPSHSPPPFGFSALRSVA